MSAIDLIEQIARDTSTDPVTRTQRALDYVDAMLNGPRKPFEDYAEQRAADLGYDKRGWRPGMP